MKRICKINTLNYLHKTNHASLLIGVLSGITGYMIGAFSEMESYMNSKRALEKNHFYHIKRHYINGNITIEMLNEKYDHYNNTCNSVIKNKEAFICSTCSTTIISIMCIDMPMPLPMYIIIFGYFMSFIIGYSPYPTRYNRDNYKMLIDDIKKTS